MAQKTALIAGASGAFGGTVASALQSTGWAVRTYSRGTDMALAASGCQLIVNGLNPPRYHDWARLVPQITASVLAAARTSRATVLVPGNVYPFGREPAPWGVDTPHNPVSRKGRIRAEMEARYVEAAWNGEVRSILLRAGDFLGTAPHLAVNSVMLRGVKDGVVTTLGDPAAIHAWAWLPDMARAAAALVAKPDLPAFVDVPFPGHAFALQDFAALAARLSGRPMRVKRFPTWIFGLASPVWELARELREMLYLFDHPHWLEGETLAGLLPEFRATPLETIVSELLAAKGVQKSI